MHDYSKFPCPCCGHIVFDHAPGFHQQCPICGWEDDLAQLRFPLMPGSSNQVCLEEAQRNFKDYGASERRNIGTTRAPFADEAVDDGWRPLDVGIDNVEHPSRGVRYGDSYPLADTTVLYYWRGTYWRRVVS
ncbi:MAG: hydrolase [Chromatiaceae bacterium]|jgi:hypothetical protein|nr:hydrolase [Chromatiaceae bacterium]